jgi:enamine deaminase RidA (YjgF/YER057c/UK114 family)
MGERERATTEEETMNDQVAADTKSVEAQRPWTAIVGYSRAMRRGPLIEVAGTSATKGDGTVVAPGDPYEQTRYVLAEVIRAIESLGGSVGDVIRTRVFLTDISAWQEVGRAHGEVFGEVRPASSFVEVSALMLPELVVEVEATAYLEQPGVAGIGT